MRVILIGGALVVALGLAVWTLTGRGVRPGDAPHGGATQAKLGGHDEGSAKRGKDGAHGAGEAAGLTLSPAQREALGITIEPAQVRAPEGRLTVTGTIVSNPDRTVVVAPRTAGRVLRVDARLGDTVEAGATLAILDSVEVADLLGELAQSESALALEQAKLDQERRLYDAKVRMIETAQRQPSAEAARRELARVELGRAKQEYIAALAKQELAEAEHERAALLVERRVGARKDLVRTEKELAAARSELDAVAETIRLGARQELLQAQTALDQARAQRDRLRGKLRLLGVRDVEGGGALAGEASLTRLRAPFTGTVIERQVTEGQLLEPSATPFRLADLRTVWALLDVPETEIGAVRRGQDVAVEAGREARMRHVGKVVFVGDVVDDQTRTVKVRVEIPNPGRHFKPGMFVTAALVTRPAGAAALMVPKSAVFVMDESAVVFVEGAEGFRPRPVAVGAELGGWVPVTRGLQAGERVVTEGGFALKAQLVKAKLGEGH